MKTRRTVAAIAAGIVVAPAAHAGFVQVVAIDAGDLDNDPTTTTWRLYAEMSDPADWVLAVSGTQGVSPLVFQSTHDLVQNAGPFDGLVQGDTPSILDAGGDSWVTIGGNVDAGQSDTQFSPGFLGGDGALSTISGSYFEQADNGGWFDANPGTQENGGMVIIAQFTLPNDALASLRGALSWTAAGSGAQFDAFEVVFGIPAPGALGLAAVMLLAGGRRRRA